MKKLRSGTIHRLQMGPVHDFKLVGSAEGLLPSVKVIAGFISVARALAATVTE